VHRDIWFLIGVGSGAFRPTRREYLKVLIWLAIFLLFPYGVFAHGVEGEIEYFPRSVVVTATYDTDEPMNYAKVEVYAPDSKIKFQSGRTDRNGCFAFVPDVSGRWQVIVSDRLGHRLDLSVNVTDKAFPTNIGEGKKIESMKNSSSRVLGSRKVATIVGFLLIFGIFGWLREIKKWRGEKRKKINTIQR